MLFSLYQILLNLSQRYKNSSRAAVGPGEPGELVCVCWGGGLCSCVCPLWVYSLCVCLQVDCHYLSPSPDLLSQGKNSMYINN